jgi:putative addiction module component (TIGR02574 family)
MRGRVDFCNNLQAGVSFFGMNSNLRNLPLDERIYLVEYLWDSIASDRNALPLTNEQKAELDIRLDAYESDCEPGRIAEDVIGDTRKQL